MENHAALRLECLKLALDHQNQDDENKVIERAKKYRDFVFTALAPANLTQGASCLAPGQREGIERKSTESIPD